MFAQKGGPADMAKQILLVDDDENILEFVQQTLEDEGYDIQTCADGSRLRQLKRGELPDLILLDVRLGEEDGRTLCRQLKTSDATRNIPIILYSAHETASQIRKEACADDFLTKPFSLTTLIEKVHRMVN
jgi:DNA-binding response OmpR family regulator